MGIFKRKAGAHQWRGVIEEYRHRLPVTQATPIVSLREGGTPLVYACVESLRKLEIVRNVESVIRVEGAPA